MITGFIFATLSVIFLSLAASVSASLLSSEEEGNRLTPSAGAFALVFTFGLTILTAWVAWMGFSGTL